MRPLTVLATVFGIAAATAGVRAKTRMTAPTTITSGQHVMTTTTDGKRDALAGPLAPNPAI